MNYILKKKDKDAILINDATKKEEYKITCIDLQQMLIGVSAINRNDKIKIPFKRVENFDIGLLKEVLPECFI